MIIRKAKAEESKVIAKLILLSMKDIVFQFIGDNSTERAIQFLENLTARKATQYSYENCWVAENEEEIIAVANIYDGAKLQKIRTPVVEMIKSVFNREFIPDDETQAGEIYLDSLGVHPDWQGKGIGSKILHFLINEYVYKKNKTLGLLVDKDNPDAKKLYIKLGFKTVGEKILAGKRMEHLQIKASKTNLD